MQITYSTIYIEINPDNGIISIFEKTSKRGFISRYHCIQSYVEVFYKMLI